MMLNNGIEHAAVYVSDLEASLEFYKLLGYNNVFYDFEIGTEQFESIQETIGTEESGAGARLLMLKKDNGEEGMIELIYHMKKDGTSTGNCGFLGLSYQVDNVEKTYALLKGKGYKIPNPPNELPIPGYGQVKVFTVQSPEDVTIEIFQADSK